MKFEGTVKKEKIRIIIQPKRNKTFYYGLYQERCGEIFNELDKILKTE
jgi:hypothetical protein